MNLAPRGSEKGWVRETSASRRSGAERPRPDRQIRYEKTASLHAGPFALKLAEEEGFEPSSPGLPVKRFSRPPHSTTLPPLRLEQASSVFRVDLSRLRQIVDNVDRLPGTVSSTFGCEHPMITRRNAMFIWRRDRDSNPRYAFGAHTISNRAPSASSVISPFSRSWPPHVFHSP